MTTGRINQVLSEEHEASENQTTSAQLCQTEFDEVRLVEVETTTSTNLTFALATKMPTYANESSWYTLIQSTTTLTSYDATRFTVLLVCCENTLRLAYEYKSFVVSFEFRRIQNIASDVIALISGVTGATATTCSRIPATSQRNDANVRANPDFSSRNYWNHFSLHVKRTSHDRGLSITFALHAFAARGVYNTAGLTKFRPILSRQIPGKPSEWMVAWYVGHI